jgi:hypothetical protein
MMEVERWGLLDWIEGSKHVPLVTDEHTKIGKPNHGYQGGKVNQVGYG